MNRHEELVHPSFPAESTHMTRMAGDLIDLSSSFSRLQQRNEERRDMYGSYPSSLSDNPANQAKILSFPSGKEKEPGK